MKSIASASMKQGLLSGVKNPKGAVSDMAETSKFTLTFMQYKPLGIGFRLRMTLLGALFIFGYLASFAGAVMVDTLGAFVPLLLLGNASTVISFLFLYPLQDMFKLTIKNPIRIIPVVLAPLLAIATLLPPICVILYIGDSLYALLFILYTVVTVHLEYLCAVWYVVTFVPPVRNWVNDTFKAVVGKVTGKA